MIYISFQLKNATVGSWNGVDTGDKDNHYLVRKISEKVFRSIPVLIPKGESKWFHYDFGDGWSMNVIAEVVDAKEAAHRRKASNGFRGREWMVDEIFKYGRIRTRKERHEAEQSLNQQKQKG